MIKTWTQFLEAKHNEANAQLAPIDQQPATAGMRTPVRPRSATLNLTPDQQAQGLQAYQQARQPGIPPGQQTRQPVRRSATMNPQDVQAYAQTGGPAG